MINLLSTELKQELRAARLNVSLRTYIIMIGCALLAILAVFAAGFYFTIQQKHAAESTIKRHEAEIADYQDVRSQAETFSSNLSIAKSILSQETLYSDLIISVAKALPDNALLTDLSLNEEVLDQPMVLSARVASQSAALTLKSTLERSAIFSDVNLASVTESPATGAGYSQYPVAVTINAILASEPSEETD